MVLTTLRIGGRATFKCDNGFGLKGDDDIECLSSGSWSSWPPSCIEVDCKKPFEIENGRVFLANGTTNIGSVAEYHCFPGYERSGSFQRICLDDGYWSGPEPGCNKPIPVTILSDNTVDGTQNVRAGGRRKGENNLPPEGSSVGLYIGIALGLIAIIGLMVLGIYFYRQRQALATKPPAPYRDRNANGTGGVSMVGGLNGYASTGVYHTASGPGAGSSQNGNGVGQQRTAGIVNSRGAPPPPIQMYSMDDSTSPGGVAGVAAGATPIYDTINDDHSSGYARSSVSGGNGSDRGGYTPSTFKNGGAAALGGVAEGAPPPGGTPGGLGGGGANGYGNNGFAHDYDTPEGTDPRQQQTSGVTINGIAV